MSQLTKLSIQTSIKFPSPSWLECFPVSTLSVWRSWVWMVSGGEAEPSWSKIRSNGKKYQSTSATEIDSLEIFPGKYLRLSCIDKDATGIARLFASIRVLCSRIENIYPLVGFILAISTKYPSVRAGKYATSKRGYSIHEEEVFCCDYKAVSIDKITVTKSLPFRIEWDRGL